jgi:hypothetical protein
MRASVSISDADHVSLYDPPFRQAANDGGRNVCFGYRAIEQKGVQCCGSGGSITVTRTANLADQFCNVCNLRVIRSGQQFADYSPTDRFEQISAFLL